jgi:hypothetical protein
MPNLRRVCTGFQLAQETRADLDRFEREIRRCSPNTKLVVPTHEQPIELP